MVAHIRVYLEPIIAWSVPYQTHKRMTGTVAVLLRLIEQVRFEILTKCNKNMPLLIGQSLNIYAYKNKLISLKINFIVTLYHSILKLSLL